MRPTALSLVLLLAAAAAVPVAQQRGAAPPQTPTAVFRGGVDVVQLDVSVLDKSRLPVTGLTAADFTVLENGTPQPVVAFTAIDVPDTPAPPTAAWMATVPADVVSNATDDRRLFVLVLDDALVPMDPAIMARAKDTARSVVNRLGPQDMASIVFTANNRNAQDFTSDKGKLLAAVDKFAPGMASWTMGADAAGGVNTDSNFYAMSVGVLRGVADFLIDIPQQRKALVWVSPGVPFDPELASAPMLASGVGKGMADREIMNQLGRDMAEAFRRAQRANVNIYAIDPSGLEGMERFVTGNMIRRGVDATAAIEAGHRAATLTLDFLQTAAANTGGRAIVNQDDVSAGITQMFRENGSYYVIGFQPIDGREDGRTRRLEVKVNRPDVEVRYRTQYMVPTAADAARGREAARATPLAKAISGLLPNPDLPMQVSLAPFVMPGQRMPTVAIVLGVEQTVPAEAAAGRVSETIELLTSAFTPEGQARGTQRQTGRITLRAGADGTARYEVLSKIDLSPGRYQLRLAAHNGSRVRSGSVYADVDVPDFSGRPLSLSGVVVGVNPARPAAPADGLASVLPIVPTAERAFLITERVTAFLRAYQPSGRAPSSVRLTLRITDARERVVVETAQSLSAEQFAGALSEDPAVGSTGRLARGGARPAASDPFGGTGVRTADIRYTLPLDRLGPGPHVLTIEAVAGNTTATRHVRFRVR